MTSEIDYHAHPERYPLDLDDEQALDVQPYAGQMRPYWRFDTMEDAAESAAALYECYVRYKEAGDFVGMDVARKLLHLGLKRAKAAAPVEIDSSLPARPGPAAIFSKTYRMVNNDPDYARMRHQHMVTYGT